MVNADFWLKKNLDAEFCPKKGGYKVWMLTSATPRDLRQETEFVCIS